MRFVIHHTTRYQYSGPVRLCPHQLRFIPRNDGAQRVIDHQLATTPAPRGQNDQLDLEGNRVTQVWFEGETDHFEIAVRMDVETLRHNPYDFIISSSGLMSPVDYGPDIHLAKTYLDRLDPSDAVNAFARELDTAVKGESLSFLNGLTGHLFTDFSREHHATGEPQSPSTTLSLRRGACRDLTVLFIDCCRARGIAARFASGYQKGDLLVDNRHLHAWPEVYLPGAGWRGFDPAHGFAIADTHVTVAASAYPQNTLPVIGNFIGEKVTSRMEYEIKIEVEG